MVDEWTEVQVSRQALVAVTVSSSVIMVVIEPNRSLFPCLSFPFWVPVCKYLLIPPITLHTVSSRFMSSVVSCRGCLNVLESVNLGNSMQDWWGCRLAGMINVTTLSLSQSSSNYTSPPHPSLLLLPHL